MVFSYSGIIEKLGKERAIMYYSYGVELKMQKTELRFGELLQILCPHREANWDDKSYYTKVHIPDYDLTVTIDDSHEFLNLSTDEKDHFSLKTVSFDRNIEVGAKAMLNWLQYTDTDCVFRYREVDSYKVHIARLEHKIYISTDIQYTITPYRPTFEQPVKLMYDMSKLFNKPSE
jgi:hypothetical protein